ncbi:MAG: metallophosphoesterase [Alphaproteobacteria bacterium]|nr:metallophosphoesterase [Alphaproteobacteria bacterium]MBU0859803.1 metallophosphoesterase [Alphaproteobacteria bacterium]
MGKLRLAVVTDIHYGFDVGNKLGSKGPRLMDAFTRAVNKYKPDCVVDMGDRISCRNRDMDMGYLRQVKDHFNAIAAPIHHMIGNHDAKFMTREDNESITGSPGTSYSRDYNGYHLVFWNPNVNITNQQGLRLSPEEIEWLRADIAATDKPVILFSHVPLDNDPKDYEDETKEYAGIAGRFYYGQGQDVRQMLEKSGKVMLCMAGHRHTKRHREINGIHYITQQSMTSAWKGSRRPTGTYANVEIEGDKIAIMLKGADKTRFDLTGRTPAL